MQRVEKKQRRTVRHRRALWLGVCAVLLAGSVTAAVLLSRPEEPKPVKDDPSGFLTNRKAEEIAEVTISRRNGETWSVERAEDGSLQMKGEGWAIDESLGGMLEDALAHLEYEDILTENREDYAGDPAAFGLETPRVAASCRFSDGTGINAQIGDPVAGSEGVLYYMTVTGDDRLFAASEGTLRDLDVEKVLLHPVRQPEILPALLDRMTVTGADGTITAEWALQGAVTDSDAGENWRIMKPVEYPADAETIASLKENAGNLRMGTWYGTATEENLKECGLDAPGTALTFHMASGSTGTVTENGVYDVVDREEKTVTLSLGRQRDESAVYVLFDGEIFTVNVIGFNAFTETNPLDTAARYPVATPLESLTELTVEEARKTVVYALAHTGTAEEKAVGEAENDTQKTESGLIVLKNGTEISGSAFTAAYERLLTVTVSGRLPEKTEVGEIIKKYTFRTASGGTHTLEFWHFDDLHDGLTQDGCTLFYLIRDGMTPLP